MTTAQRPDFAIAMRGYDRAQVDEFVAHQTARLGFAETRAQQAAASAAAARQEVEELRAKLAEVADPGPDGAPRSLQAVGERISAILEKATEAAEEVRAEAQKESDRLRSEAQAEANRMRTEAAEAGRADAEQGLAELRASSQELERKTTELTRRRDATVAELERLRRVLESALGSIGPVKGPSSTGPTAIPSAETVIDLTGQEARPQAPDSGSPRIRRVQ